MESRIEWWKIMFVKFNGGGLKAVYDILTCDETWIYQYDPGTKRQSSIWLFPGEEPPLKVRRAYSVGNKMVTTFFCKSDPIAIIPLEDRRTINADWDINHCLPKYFDVWTYRPKTGIRGLLLHHDTLQHTQQQRP